MQFTLNQRETELMIQDVENAIVSLRGKNGITSTYEIAAILMNILRDSQKKCRVFKISLYLLSK